MNSLWLGKGTVVCGEVGNYSLELGGPCGSTLKLLSLERCLVGSLLSPGLFTAGVE